MSLVHSIERLEIVVEKVLPPNWVISGECTTPSAATNVVLSKIEYIHPPADGIQEFELHADLPEDSVGSQALIEDVPFLGRYDSVPDWCHGVRIRTATHAIEWQRPA